MNRFANLRPRTWLMLTVFAVLVGLVLAQAPGVSAAVKQISRLAVPSIPTTIYYRGVLRNTDGTSSLSPPMARSAAARPT